MQKEQQTLTVEDLIQGRDKILSNARALLDDSVCLLVRAQYPRAFTLAHLASEEIAKVVLIGGALFAVLTSRKYDWKKFWSEFSNHRKKLEASSFIDFFVNPVVHNGVAVLSMDDARDNAKSRDKNKNLSLYVDFEDGHFVSPSDIIGKDTAELEYKNAIKRYEAALDFKIQSDVWISTTRAACGNTKSNE